jgi:tartrate dehydratase alpha subunit/fumarate hydratase class I-like protein
LRGYGNLDHREKIKKLLEKEESDDAKKFCLKLLLFN